MRIRGRDRPPYCSQPRLDPDRPPTPRRYPSMRRASLALTSLILAAMATWTFLAPATAAEFKLNGRTFTVPDGFELEVAAGPPLVDRPIVADFDDQGRLYVADSSGSNDKVEKQLAEKPHRIVRLEDRDGDG